MTRGQRGFTLLEIIVVLVLLALTTAVAAPAFSAMGRRNEIDVAAATVRQVMDRSRLRALQSGATATLTVDAATGRVWEQPRDTSYLLAFPAGCALQADAPRTRLQWHADGSAGGDALRVRCGAVVAMLGADVMNGAVRVRGKP